MFKAIATALTLALLGGSAWAAPPDAQVTPKFQTDLASPPGYRMRVITVAYAPGGKSPPHRHAASASIYAHVTRGAVRSQVEGQSVRVFHVGEGWFEEPGAHHLVSENASQTEPAEFVVVSVARADE